MSIPTLIVRHPKERLSKCSLEPLKGKPDFVFRKATRSFEMDATGWIMLKVDAPVLAPEDAELSDSERIDFSKKLSELRFENLNTDFKRPLLLPDATWRLLPGMLLKFHGKPIARSLPPSLKTAYPRVSKIDSDPDGGLASIEALYLAHRILGCDDPSLLADYHWKDTFLSNLPQTLEPNRPSC